ncbi:hypothetical protein EEL30_00170 (plasmid) [Brevibacillus laterosporus]|uniref:Peptidase M10 metallopeptidase domain-containing protein n=1 Tax=Brevibacillus laterosporus TaxID=1465 RepID=A0A518V1S3_BRELA|nr:hypothetical protein EEL30_00170 [Brevibacillus laterosporus]
MSKKRTFKVGLVLFSTVASLSFITTSAFADFMGGQWNLSVVRYENYNLDKKYGNLLWSAAEYWNGISSNIDFYPSDKNKPAQVKVKHPTKDVDAQLTWLGTYGLGVPQDKKGNLGTPYVSAEITIVRGMCDKLNTDDTINAMAHEIGHVLGLAHTTKSSVESLMDPDDVFDVDGPTKYDKDNLRSLYGK